jgi:YHS domain-containing protein
MQEATKSWDRDRRWVSSGGHEGFCCRRRRGTKIGDIPAIWISLRLSIGHSDHEEPTGTTSSTRATNQAYGLEGYCPVTLLQENQWRFGDATWSVTHRGRAYRFAGESELAKFQAEPDTYLPLLSGYDPVEYTEPQRLVESKRRHGVFYSGTVCLFASETNLQKFSESPERFVQVRQLEDAKTDASPEETAD